ncbi:MAG TPA: protein kinase, partial [Candidatus Acidoferrales bacterium]|nr:protein kinase [Candidatus Acidoferrales bacterium]
MDTIRICKQCQQPLPPDAPEGLCPQCLAKVALGTEPAKTIKLVLGDLPADERVGMTIGRYKLLEQIGEGGFGVVYVAEQKEPVRRRVALKVVKLGMDTRQVVARFEAERQALALMDHPNIAKVLDAGATETGRPFFVMELVRGMSITRYCDQNRLPMRERLDLFIQVCRAIQHAHQKGIVHRDIKPSNILVTLHDGVPVPKVIDFGIAKATQGVLSDKTVYTQFQQFIGTPAYMSPEQAEMSGLDIDTRSDIYSLGVLLYELLVGKTPFDQQELLAAGLDEMRRIIREIPPVRPSTRINSLQAAEQTTTANQRQSETPKLIHLMRGDLDCIVMKCLEKDRTHRYETSNGLAMDLVRFLNNEPITARPVGKFYRLQKLARRNKLAFGAAAAVALSLILGLAFSTFLFIREKKANASEAQMRRQAEAATIQAQNEAARAKAASLEAKSAELKAQEKETEAKTTLSAAEFLQGSRAIAEKRPGDALAYMARSFSDNPSNQAALTSMATLLAAHSWMVPTIVIGPANSAQFSPDGERIVTASDLGIVEVWDARNGAAITRIQVAGNGLPPGGPSQNATNTLVADHKVNSARFSPDGKRIVTAGWDQARVWDAQSGQPLTEVLQHNGLVSSAQFSPDGKCIVTVCGARAWIWEAQSGRQLAVVPPSDSGVPINSAEFSPDGRWLVTAEVGQFAIWEAQSGRLRTEVKGTSFDAVFNSAQYSPDGGRIVTAGQADY